MTLCIKHGEEVPAAWLGLEYLRLLSIPTLLWIVLSALLVALANWQPGEEKTSPGGLFLAAIAASLGFLLLKFDKISQLSALASSLVLCLASLSLIWLDLIETPFLILLNYVVIFVGSTALIFTMLPSIDSSQEHDLSDYPAVSPPRRKPFSFGWIGLIVGAGLAIYMIVIPALSLLASTLWPQPTSRPLTDMTILEYVRLHAVSGVVMCLFLATGASIGSFLNVVIYRLPRKMRLLWPPSSCPNCGYKIRGLDNLPVLAWVGLKGKCRQCQVKISMRYPVIEFTVACIFVLLFYVELLSGGGNLPVREPNLYKGIVWILLYTKWDLVSIYCLHTAMLSVLLAWGMINYDFFRVPKFAGLFVVVSSVVCIMLFPFLNPASTAAVIAEIPPHLVTCLLGLLAGAIGGYALQVFFRGQPSAVVRAASANSDSNIDSESSIESEVKPPQTSTGLGVQEENSWPDEALPDVPQQTDPGELVPTSYAVASQSTENESQAAFEPLEVYGTAAGSPQTTSDAIFSMLLVGVILGPAAALSICVISAFLNILWNALRIIRVALPSIPITLLIFMVTTFYIALWRQTTFIPVGWWPKADSSLMLILAWVAWLLLVSAGVAIWPWLKIRCGTKAL